MPPDRRSRRPGSTATPRLQILAASLLFGAPAVIVPGALNRFVFGKLAFAAIGALLASICPATGRLRRDAGCVLGLGSAVLLAAALADGHPVVSLLGRGPRYEGAFVLAMYAASTWSAARLLGPQQDQARTKVALKTLTGVAALVAFFAVLEAAGLRPLSSDVARPGSLLGNASDEGTVGVLCLGPLALVAARNRDRLAMFGAVAAVAVIVLSASRGALAAMVIELVLVGALIGGRRAIAATAIALFVVSGLTFALPPTRNRVLDASPLAAHTVTGRDLLWRETLSLDASHLGLGVGPSNYRSRIIAEHDRRWQSEIGPQDPPDSPHSFPLQALSDGGIPLLLLFLLLSGQVIITGGRSAWRARHDPLSLQPGAVVALIGYGVAGLVGITSPGPTVLASVFLGIALAAPAQVSKSHAIPRLVAGVSVVLCLVFACAGLAEIPLRHALVDVSRGDIDAADRDFMAARALRPWDLDLPDVASHAFITYAVAADNTAAVDDAAKWLRKVPRAVRSDEQVQLDTASLDEVRHNYGAARSLLSAVLDRDRSNPAVLLQRGIVEAEAGAASAAEADFMTAAVVVPQDPGPWQDLAALYDTEGKVLKAQAAARRAQRLGS